MCSSCGQHVVSSVSHTCIAPERRYEITVRDETMHRDGVFVIHTSDMIEARARAARIVELLGTQYRVTRVEEIYRAGS
jgi:hypothetical protein